MKGMLLVVLLIHTSVSLAVTCQRPVILDLSNKLSEFLPYDASNRKYQSHALEAALNLGWRISSPGTIYGAGTSGNINAGTTKGLLILEKDFPSNADCQLTSEIK
ncbi:TPA: hypothetical protein QCJ76_001743 [Enterobacter asburiae]|nr:hypothetical protein [Enterobacter asburiae]